MSRRSRSRRAVAIRHVPFEDLGVIAPLLRRRGYDLAYRDAAVDSLNTRDLAAADLVVVLGGPIGVYQAEAYPFIRDELRLLERRLARGQSTLGICFGSQLMAQALGARVFAGPVKELGFAPVRLTAAGRASALVALGRHPVLHWHGDTFDMPAGAERLASTCSYANQAFAFGRAALALQFHIEVTPAGLEPWLIGHTLEIATTPGASVAGLRRGAARWGAALNRRAVRTIGDWLTAAGV
ncbi:MAG: glutamine amidotransferase [Alphaproteobacteria bacterium]|nr:glutamine amidotransferase [Alphaproteobacteria bacterium]